MSTVLIDRNGVVLGELPAVELACPYWPEARDVVSAVRERFGVSIVVLRLLTAQRPRPPGGHVTVLAEVLEGSELPVSSLRLVSTSYVEDIGSPHPKRMPWADVGGPASTIEWARRELAGSLGEFAASQQRTWNLSVVWRLERVDGGQTLAWLKQVPPFFRHEGALLRWIETVAPEAVAAPLAFDGCGRSVLADVAGKDLYDAPLSVRRVIAGQLHALQLVARDGTDELIALGVPDRRGSALSRYVRDTLAGYGALAATRGGALPALPPTTDMLLTELDRRVAQLSECGLPDTLLHVDNQPGNARGDACALKLIDWGDAVVGNPAQDILSLTASLPAPDAAQLEREWCALWKHRQPRARPERALALYRFIQPLYAAAVYSQFVQEIEPSEWPYHAWDVPACITAAHQVLASE